MLFQKFKRIGFLVFLFSATACQYFEKNVPDKNNLLHEELNKINWNKVDQFPTILSCDSLLNDTIKKIVFLVLCCKKLKKKLL